MARIVVSDASPIIGLSLVDGLSWLPELFGEVWIPEQVLNEVLPSKKVKGKLEIEQAIQDKIIKIWPDSLEPLPNINLDEGESVCIALALASADPVLLIMDEKAGRAVAAEFDVAVVGTAAIIGLAKQTGLINSARTIFERLHQSGFRISAAVIRTVLDRVGETS